MELFNNKELLSVNLSVLENSKKASHRQALKSSRYEKTQITP